MNVKIVICANNVASLVATRELLKEGHSVTIVSPSAAPGGFFKGYEFCGTRLDIGMVFVEFDSFNQDTTASLMDYNPRRKNDSGRFVSKIRQYFDELGVEMDEVSTPRMFFDRAYHTDFLMANRLGSLHDLKEPEKQSVLQEVRQIIDDPKLKQYHASRKSEDAIFTQESVETVSLANHGRTFHDKFMEPFSLKLTNLPTSQFLGLYHRVLWLPLFYPETIRAALETQSDVLQPTALHCSKEGSVKALVDRVVSQIEKDQNLQTIVATPSQIDFNDQGGKVQTDSGHTLEFDRLIWCVDTYKFLSICKNTPSSEPPVFNKRDYTKGSLLVGLVAIEAAKVREFFSTVYVPEPSIEAYRLTQHLTADDTHKIFSIEYNADYLEDRGYKDEQSYKALILKNLKQLNIVDQPSAVTHVEALVLRNAFLVPTPENYSIFQDHEASLQAFKPFLLPMGPSAGFTMTSLNDQIVQGLRAPRAFT